MTTQTGLMSDPIMSTTVAINPKVCTLQIYVSQDSHNVELTTLVSSTSMFILRLECNFLKATNVLSSCHRCLVRIHNQQLCTCLGLLFTVRDGESGSVMSPKALL